MAPVNGSCEWLLLEQGVCEGMDGFGTIHRSHSQELTGVCEGMDGFGTIHRSHSQELTGVCEGMDGFGARPVTRSARSWA